MLRIKALPEVCIGCGLCRIWCKVEHSPTKSIQKAFKEHAPDTLACVDLEERGPHSFAAQCRHCDEPICAYSCITGAMSKDPDTGLVTVDENRCIGCWTCILMCPNGSVKRDERSSPRAIKCEQCRERGFPSCVEHCPNDALVLEEVPDAE